MKALAIPVVTFSGILLAGIIFGCWPNADRAQPVPNDYSKCDVIVLGDRLACVRQGDKKSAIEH